VTRARAFDPVARLIDPAFVSANRAGRLASRQESRLGDGAYRSRFERVSGSVAAVGVAAAAILSARDVAATSEVERFGIWILSGAIVLLAAVTFRPWADPLGRDLRSGLVHCVTGRPVGHTRLSGLGRGGLATRYDVTIGDRRFAVPAWLWAAVDDGRTVHAYYLPRSMALVSLEGVDDPDNPPILPAASRRPIPRRERPGLTR
jgi:hypothetical protein